MAFNLTQRYFNQKGVDLKSNDLTRSTDFAADMLNCQYTKNGDIEKRKGYKAIGNSVGGLGLFNYYNSTEGTNEILTIDEELYRYKIAGFQIQHVGVLSWSHRLYLDSITQKFYFELIENSVILLNIDLGTGLESSPYLAETLRAAIDALANFGAGSSAALTASNLAAAFLITSSNSYYGYYSEQVYCDKNNPFSNHEGRAGALNFENATGTQINGCIYFGHTSLLQDSMYKYDGKNLYRAGLPTPAAVSSAAGAAGSITGSNYLYVVQYKQVDAQGNIIEGNYTISAIPLTVAAKKITVTIN